MTTFRDSLEEKDIKYREVAASLQKAFPEGTVNKNSQQVHIPVQAYIKRLEEAAGSFWSWELEGEPIFYERERIVMVKGRLMIVDSARTGIGFSQYQIFEDTGKIQNLKAAINAAESDAIRNACDKFLMGWKDLAPYRDWASNPGVGLNTEKNQPKHTVIEEICNRCGEPLNVTELNFLRDNGIKLRYCKQHIPGHLLKK